MNSLSEPFGEYSSPLPPLYPAFESPREIPEPTYLSAQAQREVPARSFAISPGEWVGDDTGATDEPEIPGQRPPLPATEQVIGATATTDVVEPSAPPIVEQPREVRESPQDTLQEPAGLPQPPFEIRRTKGHTVLVSNTHPNAELTAQVADQIRDGIPTSWPEFDNGTGTSKYLVDSLEQPELIAKIRGDTKILAAVIEGANRSPSNRAQEIVQRERARLSASSEMRLAPEVAAALAEDEPQQLARGAGFASVQVVQPVATVIDADTGQRTTVYPWLDGESVAVSNQQKLKSDQPTSEAWKKRTAELRRATSELVDYLERKGIEARDLQPNNTIIETDKNGDQHLHIIDMERFKKLDPEVTPAEVTENAPEVQEVPAAQEVPIILPREARDVQNGASIQKIREAQERREQAIEQSGRMVARYEHAETVQHEAGMTAWGPADAPLDHEKNSFSEWFQATLPQGKTMKEYVQETLASIPPEQRIAIEIGGPGSELFKGLTDFGRTLGTTLTDYRQPGTIASDEARGHTVIAGNILADTTKQQIDTWLGGKKAHLIVERMFMGVNSLPREPLTIAKAAAEVYDKLAVGGVLLAQVPPALAYHIEPWQEYVEANHPELDMQIAREPGGMAVNIRIHKRPGAPEQLPLLPAKYVLWRETRRQKEYPIL